MMLSSLLPISTTVFAASAGGTITEQTYDLLKGTGYRSIDSLPLDRNTLAIAAGFIRTRPHQTLQDLSPALLQGSPSVWDHAEAFDEFDRRITANVNPAQIPQEFAQARLRIAENGLTDTNERAYFDRLATVMESSADELFSKPDMPSALRSAVRLGAHASSKTLEVSLVPLGFNYAVVLYAAFIPVFWPVVPVYFALSILLAIPIAATSPVAGLSVFLKELIVPSKKAIEE